MRTHDRGPYNSFNSVSKTFQALLAHFLVLMAIICHIRAMLSDPGYVPLPQTKIDFSSDLEKNTDHKKKRKVRLKMMCILNFM